MTSRTLAHGSPKAGRLARARSWPLGVVSYLALIVVALIAGACTPAASGQAPGGAAQQPSGQATLPGTLVFTRGTALWTMGLSSGDTREIVAAPELGQITGARGSHDGRRIAYSLYEVKDRRMPVSEIYLVNADGSGREKVLEATQAAEFYQMPVWDRDGQNLYVLYTATSGTARTRQIFRLNLATRERDVILEEAAVFDVSPDGRWMALVRSSAGELSIILLDLETRQERVLVPEGQFGQITAPRFDPTSQTLAFSGTALRTGQGTPREQPPALLAWLMPPPAYAHGDPQDVWTVPVSGGPPSKRLPMEADEPIAAWSPDGSHFAVLSFERLITIPSSGGAATERLSPGSYGAVDWLR